MKKKILLCLLLLITVSSFSFAVDSTSMTTGGYNLPAVSQNTKLLDIPITGGITQFAISINYFSKMVAILCSLGAFLMLVFNSFKLWAGTAELKKVYVDMIYKSMLCIALFVCYIPVTNAVVKFSSVLGAYCSGGYNKINKVYTEAYSVLLTNIEKGLVDIQNTLAENAFTDKNGKKYITDSTVENLQAYGMSKEEVDEWAKQHGLNIAHEKTYTDWTGHDAQTAVTKTEGWYDEDGKKIETTWFFGISTSANLRKSDKKVNKKINSKQQLQYVTKINALTEVLSGEPILSEENDEENKDASLRDEKKSLSVTVLKNAFYSPYLKDNDGNNTYFLSPNSIIKTCLVMSDAISYGLGDEVDPKTGEISPVKFNPKGEWTFRGLMKALFSLIYEFGMILSCIVIMAEYTITLLEFYIIRAVATLLIPMLFLDSTKSYAQNILRIILSYFMKILLVVLCCYFALGLYLDTLLVTFSNLDTSTTLTLCMYISTLIMGLLLVTKAPALANTVMNGNPSMGVGDIARMAQSAAQFAHNTQHMTQNLKNGAKSAAAAGQAGVRGVMGVKQTLDAAGQAASRTREGLTGAAGYTGKERDIERAASSASRATIAGAFKQSIGDKAYKAFTGLDREHLDEKLNSNAFVKAGQNIYTEGRERKATVEDVKNQNTSMADKFADSAIENSKNIHNAQADADRKRKKNMPEIEK